MSFVLGGNGKASDFPRPEAEMFSGVLLNKGVPAEKIILEKDPQILVRTFFSLKHIWRKKVLISNLLSLFKNHTWRDVPFAAFFVSSGLGQNL